MSELFECAQNDLGLTQNQLVERWTSPFNIVTDIFQVKDMDGVLGDYKAYPYLLDFLDSGFNEMEKDRCVLKSRQIGFTTAAQIEAIITAMTFEEQEIAIISNQYKNSMKIIDACNTMIQNAKYPLPFKRANRQKKKIKSDTGITLVPYSSNPDSIRSDASIRAYLDEFAFVQDQEATMDAVEPKLSRGGQITMISTPLRNDDLFMNTFNDMKSGALEGNTFFCPLFDESDVDVSQPLTSQMLNPICPDLHLDRIEKVRAKSINRFLQEYMCQPIDEINSYYPYDMILGCTKYEPTFGKDVDCTTIMGLDHALVHDETSFVINRICNGVNNIIYVETTQADYHDQLARAAHLFHQYKVDMIRADATGEMGIQVERDLRKTFGHAVTGVKYTNSVKNEMAMRLKYLMQNTNTGLQPRIYLPDHPDLIAQLHGIRVEVTAAGNERYSGKYGGGLDDIVNALWLSIPPDMVDHITQARVTKSNFSPEVRIKNVNERKTVKTNNNSYSTVRHGTNSRRMKVRGKRGVL